MTLAEVELLTAAALLPEVLERGWKAAKLPVGWRARRPVCFGATVACLAWLRGLEGMLSGLGIAAFGTAAIAVFAVTSDHQRSRRMRVPQPGRTHDSKATGTHDF